MKKRKCFKDTKPYKTACRMPELVHNTNPEHFDIWESEVVQWCAHQPELMNYLFSKLSNAGAIVFDPESRTWSGRDNALDDKLDRDVLRERVSEDEDMPIDLNFS
jgi:hypothetical protein